MTRIQYSDLLRKAAAESPLECQFRDLYRLHVSVSSCNERPFSSSDATIRRRTGRPKIRGQARPDSDSSKARIKQE